LDGRSTAGDGPNRLAQTFGWGGGRTIIARPLRFSDSAEARIEGFVELTRFM
jgi:hypothetical protein